MTKKIELKTQKNTSSVPLYINSIGDDEKRREAQVLLDFFKETTGASPKMWGESIVGFGEYIYHRSNGDEGEWMATGFSIRKSGPVLYSMPGYTEYPDLEKALGPHRRGKSCIYLKSLEGINMKVLKKLIKTGLKNLKKEYEVDMEK